MCHSTNPFVIAPLVSGIFFPQRIALKIDGRSYSPRVLETSIFCAARDPAYKLAAETLRETAEIQISARHLRNHAGMEALKGRNEPRVWHFVEPLQGEISLLIANPGRRCARYRGLRSAQGSIVAGPSAPPLTAQRSPESRGAQSLRPPNPSAFLHPAVAGAGTESTQMPPQPGQVQTSPGQSGAVTPRSAALGTGVTLAWKP